MGRFKAGAVAFVVALALGAMAAASSALGQPTYSACSNHGCGSWNAGKESNPAFKTKGGTASLTSYVKGTGVLGIVRCAKSKGEGKITGPSSGNLTITFQKCEASGKRCTSAGDKAGDVTTFSLSTELAETKGKVVIRDGKAGAKYAEMNCEGTNVNVTGAADGVVTQENQKTSDDAFLVNGGGEQEDAIGGDVLLTDYVGIGTFDGAESTTIEVKTKEDLVIV